MSLVNINVGTYENSGDGDKLRDAFIIVNENFLDTQSQLNDKLGQDELDAVVEMVDGKAPLVHTHQISQVFGLTGSLALKADKSDVDYQVAAINNTITTLVPEAPIDGKSYVRKDGSWVEATNNPGGLLEAEIVMDYNVSEDVFDYSFMTNDLGENWNISRVNVGEYRIKNDDYRFDKGNTTIYIGSIKDPFFSYTVSIDSDIIVTVTLISFSDKTFDKSDYGLNNIAIKINYKN